MILSLVSLGVFNFLFMWFASFGVSIADSGYDCYGYYDYDGNIGNSSAQIANDNIIDSPDPEFSTMDCKYVSNRNCRRFYSMCNLK